MAKWLRFLCIQLPFMILVGAVRLADFRRLKLFNSRDKRIKLWWSKNEPEFPLEEPERRRLDRNSTELLGSSFASLVTSLSSSERNRRHGITSKRNTIGYGRGAVSLDRGTGKGKSSICTPKPGGKNGGKKGAPPPLPQGGMKGPPPPGGGKGGKGGKGAGNNAGKSLVLQFKDGLWKDFVEATKPKSKVVSSDIGADKDKQALKCPLDDKTFQQVAFWERNPYFQKKLKAQNKDWYKAMVSTIAGLCSDVQGELRDECGGIFEFLSSTEQGSEEKTPKWETVFVANAEGIQSARQALKEAGKYDKPCEAASALVDIHKTHAQALLVQSAADDFLSAAKTTKKYWEEFASEFENILGEEALKKAVIANCRVMPGVLGVENKVTPLDCVSRLSESVSSNQFIQARCVALGGPRVWKEHDIATRLWKGGASNKTVDACAEVAKAEWNAEALEPTQESLSCARILPYSLQDASKKPLDMVDGPHYRFPSELLKNRKGLLFYKPSQSEESQKIYDYQKPEENYWMAEEDNVRKNWPALLTAEGKLLKACEGAAEGMADACAATRTALAEIRRQATHMTGATEEQLTDLDSFLFQKEKNSAKEIFVRVLTEYHAVEDVLAQAKADKDKGTDPSKPPMSKALQQLAIKLKGPTNEPTPPTPAAPAPAKGKGGKKGPPPPPGGKGVPPPAPGGKGPPPPAPGGKKGAPPPPGAKGGPKGGPPPPAGKGGPAASVQNFTPTKLPDDVEVSVWRWLDQGVKLWRVIFDDSRKERGSLIQKWSDSMPKYQKCAFMTRCFEYPDVMMSIDAENNQAQATTKKDYLKTTCSEYCRQLEVRVVDCTAPQKNEACKTPLLTAEGMAERLKDAPLTTAVWCDPEPAAFKRTVFYAAAESVEQVKKSTRKPFVADMVRVLDMMNGGTEPTTLMDDKAVETIWKLPPEKVGDVVVRIENKK